jgi:hypothetical protein
VQDVRRKNKEILGTDTFKAIFEALSYDGGED